MKNDLSIALSYPQKRTAQRVVIFDHRTKTVPLLGCRWTTRPKQRNQTRTSPQLSCPKPAQGINDILDFLPPK
jgi:hypothetical protein